MNLMERRKRIFATPVLLASRLNQEKFYGLSPEVIPHLRFHDIMGVILQFLA